MLWRHCSTTHRDAYLCIPPSSAQDQQNKFRESQIIRVYLETILGLEAAGCVAAGPELSDTSAMELNGIKHRRGKLHLCYALVSAVTMSLL